MTDQHRSAVGELWREVAHLWRAVNYIARREMTDQAEIDQITGSVQNAENHIESVRNALQAEIDRLAQQHPDVSLGGLQDAVSKLDPAVTALGEIKPSEGGTEETAKEEPPAKEETPAKEEPAKPSLERKAPAKRRTKRAKTS